MEGKIEMTITKLEYLLNEQKLIVLDFLYDGSASYNSEANEGCPKPLTIDRDKFYEKGMRCGHPSDFEVLKKYIK